MFAVLSDVHGNLEALEAVLADLARRPVTAVYCLGDVVGYGPDPVACLDRAVGWDAVVLGNHDQAVVTEPECFSPSAARAVHWTRQVLRDAGRDDLLAFLAARPRRLEVGEFMLVHGSARNPTDEYVFPEDVQNPPKLDRIAAHFDKYCFAGHTHVPGVFAAPAGPADDWRFAAPAEVDHVWRLDDRKTIVNVGSVGQPRDDDPRACYVTVDGPHVAFHRVPYDVGATAAKIYAVPELNNFLGDRLRHGR